MLYTMPVSLSVVSAIHYARTARTPFQRAQSLTWLLKNRMGAYGMVGIISAMGTINNDSDLDIRPLSFSDTEF